MKKCVLLVMGLSLLVGGAPLGADNPPKAPTDVPSYTKEIKRFFGKYCVECHDSKVTKEGYNLESYKTLVEGYGKKKKRAIIPGKPDESKALRTLEGRAKQMPPKKYEVHPTPEEVKRLRAWIAAGAPDDSVKKP